MYKGRGVLFLLKYIFLIIGLLVFVHTFVARFMPELLASFEAIFFVFVMALKWIGIDLVRPCLNGELPEIFYINQVGVVLLGVVVSNVSIVILYLYRGERVARGYVELEKELVERHKWSSFRSGVFLRCLVLLFLVPMAIYCTFCALNGFNGWFVFEVHDFASVFFVPIFFVFPGAIAAMLWIGVAEYLVQDIRFFINRCFKG